MIQYFSTPHPNTRMLQHFFIPATAFLLSILTYRSSSTLTALPPGYEDELLCHPGISSCLRPHPQPRGWCGQRTAFVRCCDTTTGEESHARGWGYLREMEYKEQLLQQGWAVAQRCTTEEARRCDGTEKGGVVMKIEGLVDRLLRLDVGWGSLSSRTRVRPIALH